MIVRAKAHVLEATFEAVPKPDVMLLPRFRYAGSRPFTNSVSAGDSSAARKTKACWIAVCGFPSGPKNNMRHRTRGGFVKHGHGSARRNHRQDCRHFGRFLNDLRPEPFSGTELQKMAVKRQRGIVLDDHPVFPRQLLQINDRVAR